GLSIEAKQFLDGGTEGGIAGTALGEISVAIMRGEIGYFVEQRFHCFLGWLGHGIIESPAKWHTKRIKSKSKSKIKSKKRIKRKIRIKSRKRDSGGSASVGWLALVVVARRVSFDQAHEHSHDLLKVRFAGANFLYRRFPLGDENIETGGAFQGRA